MCMPLCGAVHSVFGDIWGHSFPLTLASTNLSGNGARYRKHKFWFKAIFMVFKKIFVLSLLDMSVYGYTVADVLWLRQHFNALKPALTVSRSLKQTRQGACMASKTPTYIWKKMLSFYSCRQKEKKHSAWQWKVFAWFDYLLGESLVFSLEQESVHSKLFEYQ